MALAASFFMLAFSIFYSSRLVYAETPTEGPMLTRWNIEGDVRCSKRGVLLQSACIITVSARVIRWHFGSSCIGLATEWPNKYVSP